MISNWHNFARKHETYVLLVFFIASPLEVVMFSWNWLSTEDCETTTEVTASSSQRTAVVQVTVTHAYVCLEDGQAEGDCLVERSYTGTVLGAIVTGNERTFQVHSVARTLVKVTVQARVRSCVSA